MKEITKEFLQQVLQEFEASKARFLCCGSKTFKEFWVGNNIVLFKSLTNEYIERKGIKEIKVSGSGGDCLIWENEFAFAGCVDRNALMRQFRIDILKDLIART